MSAGQDTPNLTVSKDLGLLAPRFRAAVEAALIECNDPNRTGGALQAKVFEAYRSAELQAVYYQRGRTVKPPATPVTNAPTNEYSWHGYGLAVDVIHATELWSPTKGTAWFEAVAEVFKKHGCTWGGDWKSPDRPHFQWGRCRASPSDRARTLLRSQGVAAVWAEVGAADAVAPTANAPALRPATPQAASRSGPVVDLPGLLGKGINDLCANGFHDATANHCAHFVSHALGLNFGYTCRSHVGGSAPGANIRVHELFAECPRVGPWSGADLSQTQLVFVTRKDVVDVAAKTLANIPQKHVGIFSDGLIYHYSNTRDRVIRQTPEEFLDTFQAIYAGDQGLFFGAVPGAQLKLRVDPTGQRASIPSGSGFALRQDGARWLARKVDEPADREFLVGAEINQPKDRYVGLFMPGKSYYGPVFQADTLASVIDQWAYLLDLTAAGESRGFMNLINTYDRARFTFGFYQLAAHTPRDNLILFFRAALLEPEFQRLFPDLQLQGGRVFQVTSEGVTTSLEAETFDAASGETQLQRFMAYLNPVRGAIEQQEVLHAARLVWWANQDGACNVLQAKVGAQILQQKMSQRYHKAYGLDGELDTVCGLIADIHHQGRAKVPAVKQALAQPDKEAALLALGEAKYPERIKTLRARLRVQKAAGKLGVKRYRAALNEFS